MARASASAHDWEVDWDHRCRRCGLRKLYQLKADGMVKAVHYRWPDGRTETHTGVDVKGKPEPPCWTWERLEPRRCDLCPRMARWRHPAGGYRCNACPRPESDPIP